MAINRGEIGSIAGQVEQIAQGLVRTERSMNDLGFDTGIEAFRAAVPDILSRAPTSEVRDEVPPPRKREDEIRFI
jgi:hypothetical protein